MTRRVAVTGAASGIGRAVTELLTERGEQVIGVDLHSADVHADLSTPQGRLAAAAAVTQRCDGVLDSVVTCAGVSAPDPLTVSVNYFGTTEFVTALREPLAAAEQPRVGIVGSISGTRPQDADVVDACLEGDEPRALERAAEAVERGEARSLYPSSKAALARWMRAVCVSDGWAGAGIPVNAVAPGIVLTAMSASLFDDDRTRRAMDEAVPMPLNGYTTPLVVARALAWVTAPENSHMTGQVVYVDGGAEAVLRGSGPDSF